MKCCESLAKAGNYNESVFRENLNQADYIDALHLFNPEHKLFIWLRGGFVIRITESEK